MASELPDVIDEELLTCPLCLCNYKEPKLLPCLHTFCRSCLQDYLSRLPEDETSPPKVTLDHDVTTTTNHTRGLPTSEPTPGTGSHTSKESGIQAQKQEATWSTGHETHHGKSTCPPPIKPKPEPPKYLLAKKGKKLVDNNQNTLQDIHRIYEPVQDGLTVSAISDKGPNAFCNKNTSPCESNKQTHRKTAGSVKNMVFAMETVQKTPIQDTPLQPPPRRRHKTSQQYVKACIAKYSTDLKLTARNSMVLTDPTHTTESQVISPSHESKPPNSDKVPGQNSNDLGDITQKLGKPDHPEPTEDEAAGAGKAEVMGQCPTCMMDFILPTGGVKCIKTNIFIVSLQEIVYSQSNGEKFCNNCETSSATFRCLDCRHYLCDGCRGAHNWLKITRNHRVMTLRELQSGKYQGELKRQLQIKCDVHKSNNVQAMCLYCDKPVCSQCKTSDHTDHRTGTLPEAAIRDRDLIQSLIDSVNTQQRLFTESVRKLDVYEEQCHLEKKELISAIQQHRGELVNMINECTVDLISEIVAAYREELQQKESLDDQMTAVIAHMKHNTDFASQLLQHGTTEDILVMAKPVKINLNNFSFVAPTELDIRPFVQHTTTTISKSALLPLFGQLSKRRHSVNSPFAINLTNTADIGQTTDTNTTDSTVQPLCQLASFRSSTIHDFMGCKPTSISVTADDDIIIVDDINKKVKVFDPMGYVKLELWPLGKHALIDPWDVAITHAGHLAVTDRGAGKVKVYTTAGQCVSEFGSHLRKPWGIAANSKSNLIVSDITAKAVFVHDKEGQLLYPIECKGHANLFMCPEYVAVNSNDDIIISDFAKHCITVFDAQGRFLYRYGNKGSGPHDFHVPCGVSSDNDGCILVVDYNNRRVHKLSRDGQFEQFVLTRQHTLHSPQAIAVNSAGHLLVVDGTDIKKFGHPAPVCTTPIYEPLQFSNLMYEGVLLDTTPGACETDA